MMPVGTLRANGSSAKWRTLESNRQRKGGGVDKVAILHRRRKSSTRALLAQFEREIEPLLPPEASEAITTFKESCRKKLNGITFEAVELIQLQPGESLNEHAVDLIDGTTTED